MATSDAPLTFWRSGRWIPIVCFVVLMAIACVFLARWQFHRLDTRRATNSQVVTNEAIAPASIAAIATDASQGDDIEWRQVSLVGEYDSDQELLARKRPYEGRVGYYVVTPLVTADGPVWIARGWIPAGVDARTPSEVPAAPTGTVTVTGFARGLESGGSEDGLPPGQIHRLTADTLTSPTSAYPLWVQAESESPSGEPIQRIESPELSEGPHLSYALQWSAFAIMALIGGVVLVRRQREYFAEDLAAAAGSEAALENDGSPMSGTEQKAD